MINLVRCEEKRTREKNEGIDGKEREYDRDCRSGYLNV